MSVDSPDPPGGRRSLAVARSPRADAPPGFESSRFWAWLTAAGCALAHRELLERKRRLFAGLRRECGVSVVAEVGVGAGQNMELYGLGVNAILGVDNNAACLHYAQRTAAAAGLPPGRLRPLLGRAEALPLADASVDAVVGTYLLCSVDDPGAALAEVLRVLRPGGVYVFVEHVAGGRGTCLALAQRWLAPPVRCLLRCRVHQDALGLIAAAGGWRGVIAERFAVRGALLWRPHVAGIATRAG